MSDKPVKSSEAPRDDAPEGGEAPRDVLGPQDIFGFDVEGGDNFPQPALRLMELGGDPADSWDYLYGTAGTEEMYNYAAISLMELAKYSGKPIPLAQMNMLKLISTAVVNGRARREYLAGITNSRGYIQRGFDQFTSRMAKGFGGGRHEARE